MAEKSLYILDSMALMYRAFYAFINAPMRNSEGLNTSAMFGFVNTLLSLTEKVKPTHLVACLDPSGPTFRHEMYTEYKANRQAMPQELRESIPYIEEILRAMNIPIVRVAGYEADDLIGTITQMVEADAVQSYIVSLDKDLGQLLSPSCSFWKPGRKGSEFELVDMPSFLEEWSIETPAQIIDVLALMGDASDNIPGVPGVGAVTAKKLIAQFGSIANMLEHTDQIKGKLREKVENNAEMARLSYDLVCIKRDIPLDFNLSSFEWNGVDEQAMLELMTRLEFKGLMKKMSGGKLPDLAPAPVIEPSGQMTLFAEPDFADINTRAHDYQLVDSASAREALAARMLAAKAWAFDTETTGLDPMQDRMLGMSICLKSGEAFYVPVNAPSDLDAFRAAFACGAEKQGLNLKFDLQVLATAGLSVEGPFFDAMIAHSVLFPERRHGMDEMAETLLNYRTIHLEDIAGKGKEMDTASVPVETMCRYAAEDADITWQLVEKLRPMVNDAGLQSLLRDIEFPLVPVLAQIEREGMCVDLSQLEASSAELGAQIETLKKRIDELIGRPINLNSPKQLGDLLFGEMKLLDKPKKTKTGQFVTDEETLRKLIPISPLVADILEYRELSKLKGTYLDALPRHISPVDGRIHASLQQVVTATGRLACQNPNLQNIPVRSDAGKLIRRAFVAQESGYSIMSADYSQVELRLMAALSGDESMIAAFREGRDIHRETAAKIFNCAPEEVTADMRRASKTVNFGIIYGISAFGLSQRMDCSRIYAAELIDNYFAQFPKVKLFMDKLIDEARQLGYAETLCGRRRALPDLNSRNFNLRAGAERNAINTPIQGGAADMIKLAMLKVSDLLKGRKTRLIMQVHDELLFELCDEEKEELMPLITKAMSEAMPLPHGVPLDVEASAASNWLDAH
ncbi:MAG: DNA polymerase I [Akkermansia sp.]